MKARTVLHAARSGLFLLLTVAGGASQAAGKAVPGSQGADAACPAIRVPAGDGDLHTLLQKAAEAGGFTLYYRAQPRKVSSFEGSFSAAEFVGRLGREAGVVVQYRQVRGCAEDAAIARLWVLPTQYQAVPNPQQAVPAAAPGRPSLAEEAALRRRKEEDAENAFYVNQN